MGMRVTRALLAVALSAGFGGLTPSSRAASETAFTQGLVAHWTFDEGSGDTARDVTGNGHDATLTGTEWVASPRGYALRFDSKEDAARYGNRESMNMRGDITLALWLRVDPTLHAGMFPLLFGDTGLGVNRNVCLYLYPPGILRFEWGDGKLVQMLLAPATLLNGTWKHVVVVANSMARRIVMYIDGEVVAERDDMAVPITPTSARDRRTGSFYKGFFQGDLDDIRLYCRALTEADVKRLFESQADVQVDADRMVRFDGTAADPAGLLPPLVVRNFSRQPRRVQLSGERTNTREIVLEPGAWTEVPLGHVPLRPVWTTRSDLLSVANPSRLGRLTMTVHRGPLADTQPVLLACDPFVEPIEVFVQDPWHRDMPPQKTERVTVATRLAIPAHKLREGVLDLRLVSRETGREALIKQVAAPSAELTVDLDVRGLAWGGYDLAVRFLNGAGETVLSTERVVTVLPAGSQRIRMLNNLVSELMDARTRELLARPRIEFMNPRDGWVWFRVAGACTVTLGRDTLCTVAEGGGPVEAMRHLPAGKHVLQIDGTPTDIVVRAIPALVYNAYPLPPRIAPFGAHTWDRLQKHMLPNINMIESLVFGTPEHREWLAQGKLWLANVNAPALHDKQNWPVETLMEHWLHGGRPPAHAERVGLELDSLSGMQIDEYYRATKTVRILPELLHSLGQLSEHADFDGKLWIPFFAGRYGVWREGRFLLKTVLGSGWSFSEERYTGEMPTEAENTESIREDFLSVAAAYERGYPGSPRRMIFTPMYASVPYCMANRCPQADFRVHLDMQMQLLATDPAFFGLWGVQPYRSNYVTEEILNCMGMLLRHYCIEGKTERMLSDPYELKHVVDPDFAEGLSRWQVAAAQPGSVSAAAFAGYGRLQGRHPRGTTFGDTFAVMTRHADRPNILSQELQRFEAGRLYSLKVITGDYGDFNGGKTRKTPQTIAITLQGAEILDGGFSHPFHSHFGVGPFTRRAPFWMTYHWLQFRPAGSTATLAISDWAKPDTPGAPAGQQVMLNFVEVQPVLENHLETHGGNEK